MPLLVERECPNCKKIYQANASRLKHGRQTSCSRACSYQIRGRAFGAALAGLPPWNKGRKLSPEHVENLRRSHLGQAPPNKGKKRPYKEILPGAQYRTDLNRRIRQSARYKDWRAEVLKRDDYRCQFCLKRGGRLQADHIKPFALHPELRFDLNNGRTLCPPCHKTTDTFGCKSRPPKVDA